MIVVIIILLIVLVVLYFLFRRINKKEKFIYIDDKKYDDYIFLINKYLYINELTIDKNETKMRKRKLTETEINKIIYYIFVPDNNMDKNIRFIIFEYLDFIQKPDIIESDNHITNYYNFIRVLHEICGKNEQDILSMNKKKFLELSKN